MNLKELRVYSQLKLFDKNRNRIFEAYYKECQEYPILTAGMKTQKAVEYFWELLFYFPPEFPLPIQDEDCRPFLSLKFQCFLQK